MNAATYTPCTPALLPAVLALLDDTFVVGRGRTCSLAQRFPHLFTEDALTDIHLLVRAERPVACVIARPFTTPIESISRTGAMIGMVCCVPEARGQGLGLTLLRRVADLLAARGFVFGVLWSGLERYYERLGWQRADNGLFGTCTPTGTGTALIADVTESPVNAVLPWLESIRTNDAAPIARDRLAWSALPLPVTRCTVLHTRDAYVLVGHTDQRRYVYEMLGNPASFPSLWAALCRFPALVINLAEDSTAQRWLSGHATIAWQTQRLAMWKALGNRPFDFARAYVPYFDRI